MTIGNRFVKDIARKITESNPETKYTEALREAETQYHLGVNHKNRDTFDLAKSWLPVLTETQPVNTLPWKAESTGRWMQLAVNGNEEFPDFIIEGLAKESHETEDFEYLPSDDAWYTYVGPEEIEVLFIMMNCDGSTTRKLDLQEVEVSDKITKIIEFVNSYCFEYKDRVHAGEQD